MWPGTDSADLDLKDQQQVQFEFAVDLFLGLMWLDVECEKVTVGALHEGPNVVISNATAAVDAHGRMTVRLHCPASLDIPCAGKLTVVVRGKRGKRQAVPSVGYSLAAGTSGNVTAHLSAHDRGFLRRRHRATGAILSVEKGHFGDKTTFETVTLRA